MRRVSANVSRLVRPSVDHHVALLRTDGVLMIDTPQQPIDAMRWREAMAEHGKPLYLVNTE